MGSVSGARLTIPKTLSGEIARRELVGRVISDSRKLIYIHAGAGYGKTTLLSQIARSSQNPVWVSLSGENDIFAFVNTVSEAVARVFPGCRFASSEYLPFAVRENFITILANALVVGMESLPENVLIILDDFHTVRNEQVRELITYLMRFAPEKNRLCIGSREAPFPQLSPLRVRGEILELGQSDLAFTPKETAEILGCDDNGIYQATEGWPLAVGSCRVLLENGVLPGDIPSQGKEMLYSYLFYECVNRLPSDMVEFLKDSACFEELEPRMLDAVLDRKNSKLLLESLVAHNLFTVKTGSGYRYHALFRQSLLDSAEPGRRRSLLEKAARYYWKEKNFTKAAEAAVMLDDKELLQEVILASYRDLIKGGNVGELRMWFQALGDDFSPKNAEILVAKGVYLSFSGNFTEAQKYLDAAIPLLGEDNSELRLNAILHKARVLRNFVSFEASNELLDELLSGLQNMASEAAYSIVIEKLYNLCMNSRVSDALALAREGIEDCARAGNLKVRAWYERYLSTITFFSGNMRESVAYYEKSLALPESEREYLEVHDIGVFAAKAYQMLGDREHSLSVLNESLQRLRNTGKYEELWMGYLFAAEIYYQNAAIDRRNGKSVSFDTTIRYFTLANEYAPLYRRTSYQLRWAEMQQLSYSLIFENGPKDEIIKKIMARLDEVSDFFKCIILSRLMGYMAAVHDCSGAAEYARQDIVVGERTGLLLFSTLARGVVLLTALSAGDTEYVRQNTGRFLRLCVNNGILAYFSVPKDYGPILQFASDNGIEPEATGKLMEFAGFRIKKAYVKTFGGFAVFPYADRGKAVKMRTKKERELLAFLLDAGEQGTTKEDIAEAIWSESETGNVKKLIGVNLSQIKKDLSILGIERSVLYREKRYSVCREEIECDFELLEDAAARTGNPAERGRVIRSLYTGEYLADFEALWAEPNRMKYREICEASAEAEKDSSINAEPQ